MTASDPHVAVVLGTRPEIIKLAPVLRGCERRDLTYTLVHTGQHYSEELDRILFDQLALPSPDYDLGVGSGSHGEQTGAMLEHVERVLREIEPDVVLVQGDTNTVLAGALAASKLPVSLGHVEAGLRSFDRGMPEETNRVVADHVADLLFAPTATAAQNLDDEGIDDDRVFVTGNTVVDAVERHREIGIRKSTVLDRFDLVPGEFALLTVHRPGNVDDPDRFARLLEGVREAAADLGIEVVYPVHPRAEERLTALDSPPSDRIRLIDPQNYLDFLKLEAEARVILTDSGGVQEEACILGVPCVTLRDNTERPETVAVGANRLVGVDPESIRVGAAAMADTPADWQNPFGDGTAAAQILDIVCDRRIDGRRVSQ